MCLEGQVPARFLKSLGLEEGSIHHFPGHRALQRMVRASAALLRSHGRWAGARVGVRGLGRPRYRHCLAYFSSPQSGGDEHPPAHTPRTLLTLSARKKASTRLGLEQQLRGFGIVHVGGGAGGAGRAQLVQEELQNIPCVSAPVRQPSCCSGTWGEARPPGTCLLCPGAGPGLAESPTCYRERTYF